MPAAELTRALAGAALGAVEPIGGLIGLPAVAVQNHPLLYGGLSFAAKGPI